MTMLEDAPVMTIPIIADDVACVTKARDMFANDPSRWTAGATARDKTGHVCELDRADSVCAMGALALYGLPREDRLIVGWGRNLILQLGHFALVLYGQPSIVSVNDRMGMGRISVITVFEAWMKWREENPDADLPDNTSVNPNGWTSYIQLPDA